MVYLPSNSRQPKNFDAMQQLLSGSQKTLLFSIFLRNRTTTCTLWVTAQDFHAFNKYFTLLVSTLCIFVLFFVKFITHASSLYQALSNIIFKTFAIDLYIAKHSTLFPYVEMHANKHWKNWRQKIRAMPCCTFRYIK